MFAFGSNHKSVTTSAVGNSSELSDKNTKRSIKPGEAKVAPSGGGGGDCGGNVRVGRSIAGDDDKSTMSCLNRGSRNQVDAIYEGKLQIERPMGGKSCSSYKYKNLFTARTTPLVFIVVFYLIMANIRCDQVGSTNDIMSLLQPVQAEVIDNQAQQQQQQQRRKKVSSEVVESINKQSNDETNSIGSGASKSEESNGPSNGKKEPFDPMSFLREIYLDQNSKIVTVLSPSSDSVQKFHPNGRYGRRSVGASAPSGGHMELGKLRFIDNSNTNNGNENNKPLKSLLYNLINNKLSQPTALDDQQLLAPQVANRRRSSPMSTSDNIEDLEQLVRSAKRSLSSTSSLGAANLETELSKMLRCNFTGLPYLYWCNSAA